MSINSDNILSYNSILRESIQLSSNFPKLITVNHIGMSRDNRDIFMIKLGKGLDGPLIISGVHGREAVNPTVLLNIIKNYAEKYYSQNLKLLNNYSIYFIPLLNPDGYAIATEGYYSINNSMLRNICRNTGISAAKYKLNAIGIDINRNFPCESFSVSEFSGKIASEPETQSLINTANKYNFLGMLDVHSRGNLIYYYRNALNKKYNEKQFKIACRLSKLTGYSLSMPTEEHLIKNSGGNSVNFFSENTKLPALTLETVPDNAEFPLSNSYCSSVFNEIRNIPVEFLRLLISSD